MDNFDLKKFLAEGKLYEEADLNLPDMKVKIEKQLKDAGLDVKVLDGEFKIPENARQAIVKNPKLAAISYAKGDSILKDVTEEENLEVMVSEKSKDILDKIASSYNLNDKEHYLVNNGVAKMDVQKQSK